MFLRLFTELRAARVPVTLREHLTLLQALDRGVIDLDIDAFYHLARVALVKNEAHLDRFDRVFSHVFRGFERVDAALAAEIPLEWLTRLAEKTLTEDEKRQIEALGGWDALMEALEARLAEQDSRHQGGSKWIGTAGTSPFGAYGYNPEGVRIGQDANRNFRAVKVWDKREFKDLDDTVEIGVRNIKVALRRLRAFARTGAADELDLDATIRGTAEQGYLDVHLRPERRNTVKLLLFLDIGGSMDEHVKICEELFSAARSEFRQLEFHYFHNCLYEGVWKNSRRRHTEVFPTLDILNRFGSDYRVVFVGDAAMSPYEISQPGGSVEHFNGEAGAVWLERVTQTYARTVWLNPVRQSHWGASASTQMIQRLMGGRMYALTLEGLNAAMRELSR